MMKPNEYASNGALSKNIRLKGNAELQCAGPTNVDDSVESRNKEGPAR